MPYGLKIGTHHTNATGDLPKYPECRGVCVDETVNYNREIYAELMAFIASHGLGARRRIAECSNGVLTVEDLLNMQNCRRVTLSKWRAARAAMEQIEQEEKEQGG